jgi:hypothetical protein
VLLAPELVSGFSMGNDVLKTVCAGACVVLSLCPAHGTTLDDLKGYSIELVTDTTPVSTTGLRLGHALHRIRIYVGLSGDIFSDILDTGGGISNPHSSVQSLEPILKVVESSESVVIRYVVPMT